MNTQSKFSALRIAYPRCGGITLVEVLIALLVLSIGILGLASLQTASLNFSSGAGQQTQATALAYAMTDRLRANRQAALADAYTVAFESPTPTCAAPATTGTVAAQDLSAWRMALACRLPTATGSIARAGNTFTLIVQWDGTQTLRFDTEL